MTFQELIGFEVDYETIDDEFIKYYIGINKIHWSRIKKAAKLLSKNKLGPHVYSANLNGGTGTIVFQRVIPFHKAYKNGDIKLNKKQIMSKITNLVKKLHSLGYAHGDLILDNIGYIKGKFYILDPDTIYNISNKPSKWLKKWMDVGFEWEDSFKNFINYDYKNWKDELEFY